MNINMRQQSRKQRGFTLIEIAIVLVIIGLLLGGVLQGQQLIENSRVKSATNDFNGIAAAVFSYQDRYGRLPGDDPGARTARGSSWPRAATSGDGNGVIAITATPFAPAATDEVGYFFQDLRSAGFIAGNPTDTGTAALPANPFGGLTTIVTAGVLTDGTNALAGTKVCMGNVSGTAAIALDTQLDDGSSNTGRFRAVGDGGTPNTAPVAAAVAAAAYSEDLSYTVCYRI
jgi:prepilin-type N-terminal cleavage/methylation domain-containing protein